MGFASAPQLPELTTPTRRPSSGSRLLYFKADGYLYGLDAAGVETKVNLSSTQQYVRTASSTTVPSSAPKADVQTTIALARGYRLYTLLVTRPSRIRLYDNTDSQQADLTRPIGTDPLSTAGVMFDFVAPAGGSTYGLSPLVDGYTNDRSGSTDIAMTVTNLDTTAGSNIVSLQWIRTE